MDGWMDGWMDEWMGFLEHSNNNIIMASNSQEQLALSLTTQSSVGV